MTVTFSPDGPGQRRKPAGKFTVRRLRALAGGLLLGAGLSSAPVSAATPGDMLVMAWNIDRLATFDPASIGNNIITEILYNTCDLLADFKVDDELQLVPVLSEGWDVSEDGLELTFRLKKGIRFPSGNEMTSKDVLFSVYRVLDIGKANASKYSEYGYTVQNVREMITAPDDHTIVIKMNRPYPPSLFIQSIFANPVAAVLDEKLVREHEKDGDHGEQYLTTRTACVGGYELADWRPGEAVLLQATQNYWRDLPPLKRVMIRHVVESGTQRLLLERGDIDVARDLSSDDMKGLDGSEDIRIELGLRPQVYLWQFNLSEKPFDDPRVRKAMRYLIDYDGLGKTVMHNVGFPRSSFVPLGALGALDKEAGQPFSLDLEKARALLAEAGLQDGFETTVLIGTSPYELPIAQSIQQNAAKVGIKLNIERMASAQVISRIHNRDYVTHMATWQRSVSDAHGNASRLVFNLSNDPELKLAENRAWVSHYSNPEANEKVEAALFERDPAKREALYHELQELFFNDGAMAVMFQMYNVAAVRNELKTWTWNSLRTYYDRMEK